MFRNHDETALYGRYVTIPTTTSFRSVVKSPGTTFSQSPENLDFVCRRWFETHWSIRFYKYYSFSRCQLAMFRNHDEISLCGDCVTSPTTTNFSSAVQSPRATFSHSPENLEIAYRARFESHWSILFYKCNFFRALPACYVP